MPRFLSQSSSLLAILLITAACTRSGDWPNLSDKMPDPTERNRVIERAEPSTEPRPAPQAIVSEQDAIKLLSDTAAAIEAAEAEFNTAMNAWKQENGEARTNWMSAQVAVTRLSQTVSRLNDILFSEALNGTDTWQKATELKDRVDLLVISARQELGKSTPY